MTHSVHTRSKGWWPEGLSVRFVFLVDDEAVGEFGAIIGQHGVDGEREAVEEALEKTRCGLGPTIGQGSRGRRSGGAVDRDIGVTAAAVERRQIFDVMWMKPAGASVWNATVGTCCWLWRAEMLWHCKQR